MQENPRPEDPIPADDSSIVVPCPHCQGSIQAVPTDRPQVLDCPHCQQPFVLPAAGQQLAVARVNQSNDFVTDDTAEDPHQDDLDGRRIKQIALLKRAAYRSRSWCLIGAIGALAGAGQCLWNTITAIRNPADDATLAYTVVALWMAATGMCVYLSVRLFRRAELYRKEAEKSALSEPDRPPDFTGLSDGSQRWKNLGNLSDEDKHE